MCQALCGGLVPAHIVLTEAGCHQDWFNRGMYNTKHTAWHTVGLHCDFCLNSIWGASMFQTPNLAPHALSHILSCVLVAQSCPTLCDPIDYSPPGSSAHGFLQARILELVVIPFSRGSSQPRDQIQVSCIAARCFTI